MSESTGRTRATGILAAALMLIGPSLVLALQPPGPGDIERYSKDGSLSGRLENSLGYGNHQVDPRLVWHLQRKLLKAAGNTDEAIGSYIGYAPPPAWRGGLPASGTVKTFVLLVDFPDYPHSATHTQGDVHSKFFDNGNPSYAPYESLRNYYQRSSYSQLTIQGTVFDWYRAQYNRSHYEGLGNGPGQEALMKEALNYWNGIGHDFAQYDNDGDGTIDAFFLKWTGPDNGWAEFWWAYQWEWHSNPSYMLDGKDLGKYVWSWIANPVDQPYTARVDIHETGHLLGLPDLYDYDGNIGPDGGVGDLDMMDGNWGDHNCFSKYMLGWLAPTEVLSGSQMLTLNPSGTSQDCVLMMRNLSPGTLFGEFFMAQYRKRSTGNDPSNYPTDGLVIWHIDSTLYGGGIDFLWDNSSTSHKYIRLMEADGLEQIERNLSANAGDFYVSGKEFGPGTTPDSRSYAGQYTGVSVDQLTTPGATMSGRFRVLNEPLIVGASSLGSESCFSPNGAIDPNEQVTLNVQLRNLGGANTNNLVATLQSSGGVAEPGAPQVYGVLQAGGSTVSRPFTFTAGGTCGGTLTATLQLQDGVADLGTLAFSYRLGVLLTASSQNFDSVAAPAFPAGWTATVGQGAVAPWVTSAVVSDSAPNAAFAADPAFVSDNYLVSPSFNILSVGARLSFRHRYDLESGYDGGVLEIAVGAGAYTDVISAGGGFASGGYSGQISGAYQCPIGGRSAWTGSSGGFITTNVDLPASTVGQAVRFRWRVGSDTIVSSTGWYVDSVVLYDGVACCTGMPGDMDADGDVDQSDFALFQVCLSGSNVIQANPSCNAARLDSDGDVDFTDTMIFVGCMSGPQIPGNPACRP